MRKPTVGARRALLAAGVPIGLVASGALVWQSSYAAFSATTANAGNSWDTGRVVLADNDSGAALFNSTDDGTSTRSRCIRVDYTGDLTSDIKLYVTTPTSGATSMDPYLVMSVEKGANVTSATTVAADCSAGFTSTATPTFVYNTKQANDATADTTKTMGSLKTAHADYTTGVLVSGATVQNTYLTFKITYLVKDDNAAQNTQSSATFTWEAQSV